MFLNTILMGIQYLPVASFGKDNLNIYLGLIKHYGINNMMELIFSIYSTL